MSHKVHTSWTFGHDSQANQGAFSKGACGHGMQNLGWIFLPQLSICYSTASSIRTAKISCLLHTSLAQQVQEPCGMVSAPWPPPLPSLWWWCWQCSDSSGPGAPGTPLSGHHSLSQRIVHPKEYCWQTSAKQEITAETTTFNSFCMDCLAAPRQSQQ